MDGEDMIGEEVYKGRREHWKEWIKKKKNKKKKEKEKRKKLRRALREKSE